MPKLSICINTQTPLLQFRASENGSLVDPATAPAADLSNLREGVDYRFSPGGVTRMVYPLVRRLLKDKVLDEAHWVSLNPTAPPTIELGRLTLHNIHLAPDRMAGYGKVKEAIWGRIHDLNPGEPHGDLFWTEAFSEYAYYNRVTAELIQELDRRHDFDAFYVHDFQQMPVGHMLGSLKPKIFRWHIPFDASTIPEEWRAMLTTYLDAYDVIVVSARRYAESLGALHPKGRVLQRYPYLDPSDYSRPNSSQIAEVGERLGLARSDDIALVVARMDPMKGQDVAIRALARLAPDYPSLRLVLVGNGSFSGSKGGLGLSKSSTWRGQLEQLVQTERLGPRVVFAGHVNQTELDSLYERSRFTILPSVREGFGLVAVESWVHGRPVILTERAGVAELVRDGTHALLFDPDDPAALAAKMRALLDDPRGRLRGKLVRNGRSIARQCSIEVAVEGEKALLTEIAEA